MNFQDAIERAIGLRLRAKKELDDQRREALLELARQWEVWAENCRDLAAKGQEPLRSERPPEDV